MPNTSATGGYLAPTSTAPLDDQALDRYFHDLFTGVLSIDPTLVRPRWQMDPPTMPGRNVDWLAQGVTERRDDTVASQILSADGLSTTVSRNQELDNLVSCYGPNASSLQALLRDGLSLDQNREAMNQTGLVLVRVGPPRNASTLLNDQWVKRIDCVITFRRLISRTYAVESLLSGAATLTTDTGITETIAITP